MEMREVEAFLAVAEELHFGRAAQRLHLTASRVSQAVRTLERRVGAPLFERSSRRVRLTPLGEQLLADLGPAYRRMGQALRAAQRSALRASEVLRVGFANVLHAEIQPRLIDAFQQEFPSCRIVASSHPPTDLYRWLERGALEVDLLVTWLPGDPPLAVSPKLRMGSVIRREPRGIVVAKGHPFAGRAVVDIEELADFDVLYPDGHEEFADAWAPGVTPAGRPIRRVRRQARYMEELPALMANGDLVHLAVASMPELFPLPDTVTVPLIGLPPVVCVPVWLASAETARVRAFAEVAERVGVAAGWLLDGPAPRALRPERE